VALYGFTCLSFGNLRTLVLLTFDLLDFLWFFFIGFGRPVWWLVVMLLFGDDGVILNSLNLI